MGAKITSFIRALILLECAFLALCNDRCPANSTSEMLCLMFNLSSVRGPTSDQVEIVGAVVEHEDYIADMQVKKIKEGGRGPNHVTFQHHDLGKSSVPYIPGHVGRTNGQLKVAVSA
jgi:hypothetical protein